MELSGIPRSNFYYHLQTKLVLSKHEDAKNQIKAIYHQHKGRLGYRRITLCMKSTGKLINHKTVLQLMKQMGLSSLIRRKKYRSYRGDAGVIAPNVLKRDFKSERPGQKWATDITEFKVKDQKLYLSPIIDLFNGEIVSYNLSQSPNFKQVTHMLQNAFKKVDKKTNLILHSDQGWQYQMKAYQRMLADNGVTQSMSRKGNCLDNAVIENFFGTIKSELFYLKNYSSVDQLKTEIKQYISYYNNDRIRLNLNGMSPAQYRAHHTNR